jgi:hypothetical protein
MICYSKKIAALEKLLKEKDEQITNQMASLDAYHIKEIQWKKEKDIWDRENNLKNEIKTIIEEGFQRKEAMDKRGNH